MAAVKKSIYLTEAAMHVLGDSGHGGPSLSGRVNSVVLRYGEIAREACPALTVEQWCAVCDALNGVYLAADHPDFDPARHIWAEIADADRLEGTGAKWGVDAAALAESVRLMSFAQRVAVLEVVQRFLVEPGGGKDTEAQLRAAGAVITEGA